MEPGDIDDGTPPTGIKSKDSQLTRPGPVPLDDDSWDMDSAWLNGDAPVDESDRYHGRRRTKGTVAGLSLVDRWRGGPHRLDRRDCVDHGAVIRCAGAVTARLVAPARKPELGRARPRRASFRLAVARRRLAYRRRRAPRR